MDAMAAAVAALPQPEVLSRRQPATAACTTGAVSRSTARIGLPIWQAGPARSSTRRWGGGGRRGSGVRQGTELGSGGQGVLLDVAIPCGPAPAAGWPVLIWVGGTVRWLGPPRSTSSAPTCPTPCSPSRRCTPVTGW